MNRLGSARIGFIVSPPTCRFCGCDNLHACWTPDGPCYWIDGKHTVCSAPTCVQQAIDQNIPLFPLEVLGGSQETT
jgi:hypothetical protein